jgi:hypothetical protein
MVWAIPLVMIHLLKTVGNQDFEVALIGADKQKRLHMWYEVVGCGQTPCYRLQPTGSYILRCKVWNKICIFIKNREN